MLAEAQGETPDAALSEGNQQPADNASVCISRVDEAGSSPSLVTRHTTDNDQGTKPGTAASSKARRSARSSANSSGPATQRDSLLELEQQQPLSAKSGTVNSPSAPRSASQRRVGDSSGETAEASSTQEPVSGSVASATAENQSAAHDISAVSEAAATAQQSAARDKTVASETVTLAAAQQSAAQDMHAVSTATAAPAEAMTPTKAQQAKPANDLDRLMGSRLKSVRPQEGQGEVESAPSPVAALRGQLRRVKLEPEEGLGSPGRHGPKDKENTSANASQVGSYVSKYR